MIKRPDQINYYFFYFLILLELFIVLFLGFRSHTNIAFQNEPYYSLNEDWYYLDDNGIQHSIDLPNKLEAGTDNTITLYRSLPTGVHHLKDLLILTKHQTLMVFVDNKLIYSRISDTKEKYFDVPTYNIWNIIELPPWSEGKKLSIIISSKYPEYAGDINEIYAGTKSSFILHNLNNNGLRLMFSFITLFLGFIMILVYLFLKRRLQLNRSLLFLGWFAVLCSTWLIMESNLTQMFIENEYVMSTLTYLSLITFPIPITIYITFMESFHYKKHAYYMVLFYSLNAFLFILLQAFNILDFHESVVIIRTEIIVLLGTAMILPLLDLIIYKNKELKIITLSSCILFVFGIAEIIAFYHQDSYNTGSLFQVGFMIFITILSWDALRKVADIVKLSESAMHYKFLATKDLLTSCRNRVAYAKDMERISLDRYVIIFVADMDNMKQINDTYGHHAGDEAIIHCSQCLLRVFGRRVYRIGGDEFVIIQYDLTQAQIDHLLEEFKRECVKENELSTYPFTMSIGYAVYDKGRDETIHDTFKRADRNMYEAKHNKKDIRLDKLIW